MSVTIRHNKPLNDDELPDLSARNPGYQLERARAPRRAVRSLRWLLELYRPNATPERIDGLRVTLDPELPGVVVDISDV
jgi:hypothetical protein